MADPLDLLDEGMAEPELPPPPSERDLSALPLKTAAKPSKAAAYDELRRTADRRLPAFAQWRQHRADVWAAKGAEALAGRGDLDDLDLPDERVVHGVTTPATAKVLNVAPDRERGLAQLTAAVAPKARQRHLVRGYLSALGRRAAMTVPEHGATMKQYRDPLLAELDVAILETAKLERAVDQGVVRGRLAELWRRVGDLKPAEWAELLDLHAGFATATSWIGDPELTIHPLVRLVGVAPETAATAVEFLTFPDVDNPDLAGRLDAIAARAPRAVIELLAEAMLTDDDAEAGWTPPSALVDAAVELARAQRPDAEFAGLDHRLVRLALDGLPSPLPLRELATGTPPEDDGSDPVRDASMAIVVEQVPDGHIVSASPDMPPEARRGLAPTGVMRNGRQVLAPVHPEPVPVARDRREPHGRAWAGVTFDQLAAGRPGWWLQVNALGSDDRRHHLLVSILRGKLGVDPTAVETLPPHEAENETRTGLVLGFANARQLRDAWRFLDDDEGVYGEAALDRVAYVNHPDEAPAGTTRVEECFYADQAGGLCSNMKPDVDPDNRHAVVAYVPTANAERLVVIP